MRNEFAVSLGILMLLANSGLAQETGIPPAPAPFRNDSAAVKNPARPEAIIDHLLRAAEHLEAAGRADDASRLRDEAKRLTLSDELLGRKEAELECLQQEVDRLRSLVGQNAGVLLEFVTVEVDRRKLGLKTREFDKLIGWKAQGDVDGAATQHEVRPATSIADANPSRLPLFRELREKGALRVLSEPTLASVAGRPASFLSGGQIPLQLKTPEGEGLSYAWFGTRIEIVSVLLPDQRIRMNADVELRDLTTRELLRDGQNNAPPFVSRRFRTQVEMQLGQTLTLLVDGGPTGRTDGKDAGSAADSTETITFITPRLARPREDSPIVPIAAEDDLPEPVVRDFAPDDRRPFGPPVPVLKRRGGRD